LRTFVVCFVVALILLGGCFSSADDAKVPPRGVFRTNLDGRFYQPVDKKYDPHGRLKDLAAPSPEPAERKQAKSRELKRTLRFEISDREIFRVFIYPALLYEINGISPSDSCFVHLTFHRFTTYKALNVGIVKK
jgi:hypothetical protein